MLTFYYCIVGTIENSNKNHIQKYNPDNIN